MNAPKSHAAIPATRADDQHLTYEEAARFLNLKLETLYSMVSRREIPHIRLGRRFVRFSRADLLRWLDNRRVNAGGEG